MHGRNKGMYNILITMWENEVQLEGLPAYCTCYMTHKGARKLNKFRYITCKIIICDHIINLD
jgi:hypothetical protein